MSKFCLHREEISLSVCVHLRRNYKCLKIDGYVFESSNNFTSIFTRHCQTKLKQQCEQCGNSITDDIIKELLVGEEKNPHYAV